MTTPPTIPPDDRSQSTSNPIEKPSLSNVDRLLEHLDPSSLAAQLVDAHRLKSITPEKNMQAILKARLQQAKEALERSKD
jgi:hypothetical protein